MERLAMRILLISLSLFATLSVHTLALQTNEAITCGDFETATTRTNWCVVPFVLPGCSSNSAGIISNNLRSCSGNWYGFLGDSNSASSNACGSLYQRLTFPTNTYWLDISFYLNISSADSKTKAWDTLTVLFCYLNNTNGVITNNVIATFSNMDQSSGTGSNNYSRQFFTLFPRHDLGTKGCLMFTGSTDGSYYTTFRVDDVSVHIVTPDPPPIWTLTPSVVGGHGTISPSIPVAVTNGDASDKMFYASPDNGYDVCAWYDNGNVSQWGGTSFGLGSVVTNHAVSVVFTQTVYTLAIMITAGEGTCVLDPPGGSYPAGTKVSITACPADGYQFSEWSGVTYSLHSNIVFQINTNYAATCDITNGNNIVAATDSKLALLNLSFVQLYNPKPTLIQPTAQSTPMFIIQPTPSWLTVIETCDDLNTWCPISTTKETPSNFQFPSNHDIGFIRGRVRQVFSYPPFMKFPIHDGAKSHTWLTAKVTAIMDHYPPDRVGGVSVKQGEDDKHIITTYLGDTMSCNTNDKTTSYAILGDSKHRLSKPFEFTYAGVSNELGAGALQYDNHLGYDYDFDEGTNIYPVYGGETATDADFVNTPQYGLATSYMTNYHAVIVIHKMNGVDMGICTIYMHLLDVNSDYVDKSDANKWLPKKHTVDVNTPIGQVGGYNLHDYPPLGNGPVHLHFGVWIKDSKSNQWIAIDPYGAEALDNSNGSIYPKMWMD